MLQSSSDSTPLLLPAVLGVALSLLGLWLGAEWQLWRHRRTLRARLATLPCGAELIGRVCDWRGRELLAYHANGILRVTPCWSAPLSDGQETAICRWLAAEALVPAPTERAARDGESYSFYSQPPIA